MPYESQPSPHNEYVEERDCYRILLRGQEIARLSYAESYEVARLYSAAPELLGAALAVIDSADATGCSEDLTVIDQRTIHALRAAVAKANGVSLGAVDCD